MAPSNPPKKVAASMMSRAAARVDGHATVRMTGAGG